MEATAMSTTISGTSTSQFVDEWHDSAGDPARVMPSDPQAGDGLVSGRGCMPVCSRRMQRRTLGGSAASHACV